MSLIHALVARGTTVLAEHATGKAELKPGEHPATARLHRRRSSQTDGSCANNDLVQDPAEQFEADL